MGSKQKTTKIWAILMFVLGLMFSQADVIKAVPMGTGFTYQGRLIDANVPADGLYDLQFKLYDANVGGTQKGSTIDVNELDVIDGQFTVLLDFGSNVFDGGAVWLEIGVRPGSLKDPNTYTKLSPRQEVTPTPYALQTRGLFVDSALNVGIGTTSPVATLDVTNPGGHTAISGKSPWIGVYGIHNSTSGTFPGVLGDTNSLSSQASGVRGKVTSTSPGSLSAGVWGINAGTGSNGVGVRGTHDGHGTGVYGSSPIGTGVYGLASDSGNYINFGGRFEAAGSYGRGVYGEATATGEVTNYGGYFEAAGSSGRGVYSEATNTSDIANYGGYFVSKGGRGKGVYGEASDTGDFQNEGGRFAAQGRYGRGVHGVATGSDGRGVYGLATHSSGTNYGVYGQTYSSAGYAGYFDGNVYVTLNVSALSFTDRTPYPKDLPTAYEAVMSMERLPDGEYDEHNKEVQLDHSKLTDFIRSEKGNRDLSATVSAHNEVLKDLIRKVEAQQQLIEMQNVKIQQLNKGLERTVQQLVKAEEVQL